MPDNERRRREALTEVAVEMIDSIDRQREATEFQAKACQEAAARISRFVALFREMLAEVEAPPAEEPSRSGGAYDVSPEALRRGDWTDDLQ